MLLPVILLVLSCEVEDLQPEEALEYPGSVYPDPVLGPDDIIVPCTLPENSLDFNGANIGLSSIDEGNGAGITSPSNAYYSIDGYANVPIQDDIVFYFITEPVSGEYITTDTYGYMESGEVKIVTGSYPDYYTSTNGGIVYVQNYGDSIRLSYCDVDYTGPISVQESQLSMMLIK